MCFPVCPYLPKERGQVGSTTVEKVAAPSEKTTDAEGISWDLVAAHRPIALLDPPANGSFTGIIGAIQLLVVGYVQRD